MNQNNSKTKKLKTDSRKLKATPAGKLIAES